MAPARMHRCARCNPLAYGISHQIIITYLPFSIVLEVKWEVSSTIRFFFSLQVGL